MASKTNLYKRGDTYYLRYKIKGKLIRQSLGVTQLREAETKRKEILQSARDVKTEKDVVEKVARAKKLYNPKKLPFPIVWDYFKKHLIRIGSTSDTISRYKYKWGNLKTWIEANHQEVTNLNEITNDIAKEYADVLLKANFSSKVYNETINLFARILDLLKTDADITINPFETSNIPRRTKEVISRKELTEEQTCKLLTGIPNLNLMHNKEMEVLFHIGTWSGLRLKDATLLKWDDIDFISKNIFVEPCKTRAYGTKVKIPIHPILHKYLTKAMDWKINEYVLPQLAGKYLHNSDIVGKYVRKVFEQNGFINKKNTKRLFAPCIYGFHSLRYTFVSACAKAGIPATLVEEIVGHRNPAMTKHYTKFDDKYRQNAINSLQIALPTIKQISLKEETTKLLEHVTEEQLQKIRDILAGGGK